ncbi:hypothetical protein RISK_001815 [Rhodopirellula islandica]|uniref:Uncharacterized protein n=1 Tax=Rhodopirellula islandica TaxID=595434 RepID=A0A0J1EKC2_RHOIS|nr:hypothetical protein RISK_001815 [Rhodopirellula islandica]
MYLARLAERLSNVSSPCLLEQPMSRPRVADPLFSKDAGMIELDPVSRLGIGVGCEMFAIDVLVANAIFLPASTFLHPRRVFRW